jgi:hypothetical protein
VLSFFKIDAFKLPVEERVQLKDALDFKGSEKSLVRLKAVFSICKSLRNFSSR